MDFMLILLLVGFFLFSAIAVRVLGWISEEKR